MLLTVVFMMNECNLDDTLKHFFCKQHTQIYFDYMDDVITNLQERRIAIDRQEQQENRSSNNVKKSL